MGPFIYPDEIARRWLEAQGIDWEAMANDRGGIASAQLAILRKAARFFGIPGLVDNARATIARVEKSQTKEAARSKKEERAIYARNLYNTVVGTLSTGITEQYNEAAGPDKMLQWLPSSADNHDMHHALNYGKVMSVKTAEAKELGTRYGCKCGWRFLSESATIKALNSKFSKTK